MGRDTPTAFVCAPRRGWPVVLLREIEDEVWWSRLARPTLHTWQDDERPLHLVEQTVARDDPDLKALACYGLLARCWDASALRSEEMWLRFIDGRPVSAVTIAFLRWCAAQAQARHK